MTNNKSNSFEDTRRSPKGSSANFASASKKAGSIVLPVVQEDTKKVEDDDFDRNIEEGGAKETPQQQ